MEYYDLIIVGAGPSGSTLANALRNSGKRILILDKQAFPRDKTCAGWVTPAVMESLNIDLEDYGSSRTLQPISQFRIGMMGQPPENYATRCDEAPTLHTNPAAPRAGAERDGEVESGETAATAAAASAAAVSASVNTGVGRAVGRNYFTICNFAFASHGTPQTFSYKSRFTRSFGSSRRIVR